ncbi:MULTISPECIES: tyrosine-type recombinase/integrase [unclassified Photobacterium]|uniref:tyrosine-type recombinase/integrase n=1 Tax=unclassified Photobacterium TaxID=2628852 RepID=UPI001EDFBA48|nr:MULTISPECIES: tyrosine-type recombinase/integrase [unclassified Photobacterium]MCG3864540.1 tyrosine-type recombinase/integrase [Photobacterium sp. Ph6]MCG3876052.1 tyrosine-type recombinase/integrase [Photobacterium sp. Ph5]
MQNNLPIDPSSTSLRTTSLRKQTQLAERINHINYASANPALSYIHSLAATDTTGGQANARYTLERLARYIMGNSFQLIDWKELFTIQDKLIDAVKSFLIARAKLKAKMKNHYFSVNDPIKNLQVNPLLNALLTVAQFLHCNHNLPLSRVIEFEKRMTVFDLASVKTSMLDHGWLQSIPPQRYDFELTKQSEVMLEAFSCFCIRSCVERFDWRSILFAPLLQSTMQSFLSDRSENQISDRKKAYAPATADNLLRMLRGVAQHAWLAELISVETLERIKAIKLPRGSRQSSGRYLSYHELDHISAITLNQKNENKALRDNAIFWLMYEAGLRRAEVVSANMHDIDMNRCQLRVVGKGNKERYVPFSRNSDLYNAMEKWLTIRRQDFNSNLPALFCTINRYQTLTQMRLTTQTLNDLCKQLTKLGFSRIVSPHDFRHSVATNLLRSGYDLLLVSKFMGHSSITTTQRYDRRTDDDLKGVIPSR